MKIAIVISGGLHPSGREQVVPSLLALFSKLATQHDLHAFALRHLPTPQSYQLDGFAVHDLGRPSAPIGLTPWAQARALRSAMTEHGDLVHTRSRREVLSRDLLDRDRRLIALVSRMPFVRMVAVSGSLAHLNAERSADLDLFVITAPHRVWSVTLSVLVIARLLGWRQRMCLNYVISENALAIAPADLFSANQIIHLRPIVGHDVFARFIAANPFVREFYPNFVVDEAKPLSPLSPRCSNGCRAGFTAGTSRGNPPRGSRATRYDSSRNA